MKCRANANFNGASRAAPTDFPRYITFNGPRDPLMPHGARVVDLPFLEVRGITGYWAVLADSGVGEGCYHPRREVLEYVSHAF